MINWITVRLRWLRRKATRTHWAARLMGISPAVGEAEEPGLILIQVDGLSRIQLQRAIEKRNMPFLGRLLDRQHFKIEDFYSGVPSTTPAVQGEIFFGVRCAVPSFQFLHRSSGQVFRMYEASAAEAIEAQLEAHCSDPLLNGGSAYSNIYRAGAARTRYCARDFAPDEILRHLNPLRGLILSIAYLPKIIRMTALAFLEVGLAIIDAFQGLYKRSEFLNELSFLPTRVMVCVVLRELIRFRVLLDVERGVQTIHANFLGFDEQAHRRGPRSAYAHWTLLGIDRAIRDIYRGASRSDHRDYELIVYSDHGQEESVAYPDLHGRPIDEALREVFSEGPLAGTEVWIRKIPELVGNTLDRCRHLLGLESASAELGGVPNPAEQILITAMGPLGHVYLPTKLTRLEMENYANALVMQAHIPLVLYRVADDTLFGVNRRGQWILPNDRAEVLGTKHPHLDETAEDLVQLSLHPDSGDFIISGWDPQSAPLTFPMENGAHGGPGYEETGGFLLVPDRIQRWHVAHLANTRNRVRGEDLRKIALHYLGRNGKREERISSTTAPRLKNTLKVMTYNIHSCVGIDGKLRPERIARVINCCDPDIVAVQEVDSHRARSGGHDQAQVIADHLRMTHVFHAMLEEEKERYGIAIFSQSPFQVRKSGLLTHANRRRFQEARGAIWIELELDTGKKFHFINTHFGLGRFERRRQVEELLSENWLGGISADEPIILCGDLNSGPSSVICQRLRSRFREVQDAAENHRPRGTFSSVRPFRRIDHIFVSSHFTVDQIDLPSSPTAVVASDHRPLCAEITLCSG